jgi:hypothetical protein
MLSSTCIALLSLLLPGALAATKYDKVKEYSGPTFFDDWNFYGHCKSLSENLSGLF